jgi:SAM-dependent methyltransferase
MIKTLSNCRLCTGNFFEKTLKLKSTPPANELYPTKDSAKKAEKFPLEVVMCQKCRHVQLKHIVSPKRLFDEYIYKSGTSKFFNEHFDNLASKIASEFPVNNYVLEVGSNDGVLLTSLNKRGIKSIGIEPSEYLAKECINRNLNVYNSYLDENTVVKITQSHGKASIVLGNNVFAHIEDMKGAFKYVFEILEDSGIFIFEVAHFKYILTDGLFDTIYHEHMSYHTATALESFATASGFKIFRIEKISSHGGSLRFYLSKNHDKLKEPSVELIKNDELKLGLNQVEALSLIEDKIKETKESAARMIKDIGLGDNTVFVGYGAPAKVVTFLAQMELEEINLIGVIEDNVEKQNRFLPGSGFAIKSLEEMKKLISVNESNEVCLNFLIFPWNLKKEIVEKLSKWVPKNSNAVVFFPKVEKVEI